MALWFNPKRLVDIDTMISEHVCTITLKSEVGARVIARSTVDHLRLIGVIADDDIVCCSKEGRTLTISIEVPMFNVEGLMEVN
jgi:hypothetical protein